jgi:prepilin-type N-terminal cleavage/methylation domain-containing protein
MDTRLASPFPAPSPASAALGECRAGSGTRPYRPRQGGFTLLEMAAVVAVLAILLAAALPAYGRLLQRQQLRGAADALLLDLRHARELSVSTRSPVYVSVGRGQQWCWGVSSGQPCDCSGAGLAPACNISQGRQLDYGRVRLEEASDAEFEPRLGGAPRHGGWAFSTDQGERLRVELSGLGRARQCGPAGAGAPAC